jgi:hypothetical protein
MFIKSRYQCLCQRCLGGVEIGTPVYWLGRGRGVLCMRCAGQLNYLPVDLIT